LLGRGVQAPTAKGKCLLGPNPSDRHKKLFEGAVRVLTKVLEAYISEAAWPTEPTRGQTTQPPQAMAQFGGIVA
jgi:hypothetical protein